MFGVPEGARKSKPFVDHVMGFSVADGKIWVRNYEVNEVERTAKEGDDKDEAGRTAKAKSAPGRDTEINLMEIGPRFVLTPIIIQEGSFGGPIIYQNKRFVSPNQVRSDLRKSKAGRHNVRAEQQLERKVKRRELGIKTGQGKKDSGDGLDTIFK